jgi:single-strand DNA-binding protein
MWRKFSRKYFEGDKMSVLSNLNSVLLEGVMTDKPLVACREGVPMEANFVIISNRVYRDEGKLTEEVNHFRVQVLGKLAEGCAAKGEKGRGVRVVGRLRQVGEAGTVIIAEHIEFKPMPDKSSTRKRSQGTITEGENS